MSPLQAYRNGEWVVDDGLTISVDDPGFMMGATITERLRTFAGRVWRQGEHLKRLRRSAKIVGIDPSVPDELDAAVSEFVRRHEPLRKKASVDGVEADWTIAAFATPGLHGEPTRVVHGAPLPFDRWADDYEAGVSVRISDHRQTPGTCWPTELKCRSRMHYYLADRQAEQHKPGAKAILLDQEGFVGEGSIANVVIYNADEGIVSPKLTKVLPGVTVGVLRELASAEGVPFIERDIPVEEFRTAEEAWFTSTSSCLLPIVRCDGRSIGDGRPGAGYHRMLEAWNRAVGIDIAAQARRMAGIGE